VVRCCNSTRLGDRAFGKCCSIRGSWNTQARLCLRLVRRRRRRRSRWRRLHPRRAAAAVLAAAVRSARAVPTCARAARPATGLWKAPLAPSMVARRPCRQQPLLAPLPRGSAFVQSE
jgi:hypothetical protein